MINNNDWLEKKFIGIDFSGSARAGRSIWVAEGFYDDGVLKISACSSAAALPNSSPERDIALKALRHYIARQSNTVIGLDFPFGLPEQLVEKDCWEDFIRSFPKKYSSPAQFRNSCRESTGGRELKRATDRESRAPFSPYNLRLFRQTYYGILKLLFPLVENDEVSVLPMQKQSAGKPWLIEVCPASYLKREGYNLSYKGRTEEKFQARMEIIKFLEKEKGLKFESRGIRETVLNNRGGDALDSVIAVYCMLWVGGKIPPAKAAGLEGYIFY